MTFEGLLVKELNKIVSLSGNVYPLSVPESVPTPYIAYCQSGGEYSKTLDGFSIEIESSYEVNVLANTYSQLKAIQAEVVLLLKDMIGKQLNYRVIQDIDIEVPTELYEEAIKLSRSNIRFTVYY